MQRLLADGRPDMSREPETLEYARGFFLLPGVKKEDVGKPRGESTGEEDLVMAGKTYHAMWYETKGRRRLVLRRREPGSRMRCRDGC